MANMLKYVNNMLILNLNEIFRKNVHYDNIESGKNLTVSPFL